MKQTVFFKSILLQVVMLVAGTDIQAKEAYAVMTAGDFPKLTFYYDDQKASRNGMDIGPFGSQQERGWHDISGMHIQSMVRDVEFDSSFADYTGLTSTAYWFYGCQQLKTITGIENLKTDNVTDMSYMFYGCTYIESLDVSHFNTSKVTNMSGMFYGCRCVTSLDLSHFDTSNVTNMGNMFNECASLTSIDVSHFNTSKVTDMNCLFYDCSRLTSLDVTNFDTSNVTDMHGLFFGCRALTSLDVSNFDTSNVTQMYWMFEECDSLVSLDLSNFNTSNVTGMDMMFAHCYALASIDLSSFNTSKVTWMGGMFHNCKSLTVLDLSTFDTSNVTSMSSMFNNCESLTTIYGSNWDTSKSVHTYSNFSMFQDCNKLVGGKGTTYYMRNVDETYARIDQGKDAPGYFTEKDPVDVQPTTTDYRPFVEDGKVWKVGTISGNPVQVVDYYYFDGDTIIDGKTCKQMMCQRYVAPDYSDEDWTPEPSLSYVGAWYEENQKVYFYDERTQSMTLKYDFSIGDNESLQLVDDEPPFIIGPKQTGGLEGFKGVYRDVMTSQNTKSTTWLESVGGIDGPMRNVYAEAADHVPEFLMSCTVGDEVIYLNDEYEDGATPEGARKDRIDFTHTIKIKPKAPKVKAQRRIEAMSSLYGEYNDQQLGINLNSLDDAYQVSITDEAGKALYEKTVDAGTIVGLSIDISAYAKGRYTVTVENNSEVFTGEFGTLTTGIEAAVNKAAAVRGTIYDLQGRLLLGKPSKGLYIQDGKKYLAK